MSPSPADRFDDIPPSRGRVGAHRAENPRFGGPGLFLWAAVATVVLIGAGIFASLVAQGRIVLFPEPAPTAAPVDTVAPVVDTSYTVLVLNGTPEAGLATRVKDELVAQGWPESGVLASNAGDREFPTTTVYYAAAEAEAAARGLAGILGAADVVLDPEYPLPGTPATQLTVIVGTDRTAAAESDDGTEIEDGTEIQDGTEGGSDTAP
ncbi:LytR C-terminal domain-containing protein [Microbacterium limosum]|uniref:LytR C-terminal domain-containing protein n=1 Tax=Microbacterium limosum TaxID=3079935 RepID=A0AAU0MFX0_9MICO|nr:LytR C-terminal domain-containing protein [Microbacterium sp. Y20]WOQ69071.1 LytR C-terminal domain-containing protein [Microbacterium sp. Y20]